MISLVLFSNVNKHCDATSEDLSSEEVVARGVQPYRFEPRRRVRCDDEESDPGELFIKDCVRTTRRNCVRTILEFAYELFINDCV